MLFGNDASTWEKRKGIFTATEIRQQPATWRKTIDLIKEHKDEIQAFINQVLKQDDYDIILCGAGTSEFVGNCLFSYLNKETNYKVKSYATTDLVAAPENYLSSHKPTLLVSFGRSGNSPESIGAIDVANEVCGNNVYHLFVTCNQDGALSKAAQKEAHAYAINLCEETHDQGFAMTSSYTNMMLASLLCFTLSKLDEMEQELIDIIDSAERFLESGWQKAYEIVNNYDFNRIVYLGANACKGVAQESSLKMLELTAGKVCTMFDTPLGFRHGPKSIIDDHTLTILYISDDPYSRQYEMDLLTEMRRQQGKNKIVTVSAAAYPEWNMKKEETIVYGNAQAHDNMLLAIEYVLFAQMLALFKSLSLDITPDNPCPSGEVNRVVKGVTIYPYKKA